MNAIHNVYSMPGRAAAIAEITRVFKPGGAVRMVGVLLHALAPLPPRVMHGRG